MRIDKLLKRHGWHNVAFSVKWDKLPGYGQRRDLVPHPLAVRRPSMGALMVALEATRSLFSTLIRHGDALLLQAQECNWVAAPACATDGARSSNTETGISTARRLDCLRSPLRPMHASWRVVVAVRRSVPGWQDHSCTSQGVCRGG